MCVEMKAIKEYNIPFVGLKVGTHYFDYQIDNTFFQNFKYEEFNASNIKINLEFEKKTTLLELLFSAKGSVNINCDLTNEPFNQDIEDNFRLVVKFGEAYNDEEVDILVLPHGEFEINVAQYIYELVVLAVPTKRVHPGVADGTLNSDILDKLKELSPEKDETIKSSDETDPRWDNLKKLLTDK